MSTQEVAQTILQQLGGKRFIMMTGVTNLGSTANSLSMKLTSNKAKATHLTITLELNDTYTMKFVKVRNFVLTPLETIDGLYFDQLQEVFTRVTGLYTHL